MYISTYTSTGNRDLNEDTVYPESGTASSAFLLVADGLGGHMRGDEASKTACQSLLAILEQEDPASYVLGAERMSADEVRRAFLSAAVRQTASVLYHHARETHSDMGTTLVVVWLAENVGYVAHAGDSLLFVSEDGEGVPVRLTEPHRRGSMLVRSLGSEETVQPDVSQFIFDEHSYLVAGSDGLWEYVTPQEMYALILATPPESIAEALVKRALEAGSDDNVSAVVALGDAFIARSQSVAPAVAHAPARVEPVPAPVHAQEVKLAEPEATGQPAAPEEDPAAAFARDGFEALARQQASRAFICFERIKAEYGDRLAGFVPGLKTWAANQTLREDWVEGWLRLFPEDRELRKRWAILLGQRQGKLDAAQHHWGELYRQFPDERQSIADELESSGKLDNTASASWFLALARHHCGPGVVACLRRLEGAMQPAELRDILSSVARDWPATSPEHRLGLAYLVEMYPVSAIGRIAALETQIQEMRLQIDGLQKKIAGLRAGIAKAQDNSLKLVDALLDVGRQFPKYAHQHEDYLRKLEVYRSELEKIIQSESHGS